MSCPAHALAKSRRMLLEEDVDLIREATALLSKDRIVFIVDLGLGSGTTALSAFAERSEQIRLVSVDNEDVNIFWGSKAVENISRRDDFRAIKSDLLSAASGIRDNEIDLLLIDGMPDETEKVLRLWLPKIRAAGYVWVHDYGDPQEFGTPFNSYSKNEAVAEGVAALVNEGLLKEMKVAGLGWLGQLVDTEVPTGVSPAAPGQQEEEPLGVSDEPAAGTPEAPRASSEPEEPEQPKEPANATDEPKKRGPGRPRKD